MRERTGAVNLIKIAEFCLQSIKSLSNYKFESLNFNNSLLLFH